MPVIKNSEWILDRPKWAIKSVMDSILEDVELKFILPGEFMESVEINRMINSDTIKLDLLDQSSLLTFTAFLKKLLVKYEGGEYRNLEDYRQDYIKFLKRFIELLSLPT